MPRVVKRTTLILGADTLSVVLRDNCKHDHWQYGRSFKMDAIAWEKNRNRRGRERRVGAVPNKPIERFSLHKRSTKAWVKFTYTRKERRKPNYLTQGSIHSMMRAGQRSCQTQPRVWRRRAFRVSTKVNRSVLVLHLGRTVFLAKAGGRKKPRASGRPPGPKGSPTLLPLLTTE